MSGVFFEKNSALTIQLFQIDGKENKLSVFIFIVESVIFHVRTLE